MTGPEYKEGQRIQLGAHELQIRRLQRRIVLVLVLAAVGAVGGAVGFLSARSAASDNCRRIHTVVEVGGRIIADQDSRGRPGKTLRQYRKDGLLTQAQFEHAMSSLRAQLQRWNSADCPPPKQAPTFSP